MGKENIKMLENLKNIIPKERSGKIAWFSIVVLAFFAGWIVSNGDSNQDGRIHDHAGQETATTWTCSMHPQIQQPESGQCPLCGMDLIPVKSEQSDQAGWREITLSDRAKKLANIQVAPVERKFVSTEIRMVGKIGYDETRLGYITARVPGRIDRMYVDYTGISVRKGDHLVELYSPELLSTQQELIQTLKYSGGDDSKIMQQNVASIHERLRLWGLTSQQIKDIESSKKVTDHVTIYAPSGGIVVQRDGMEGMYVKTGTRIYTIADLSRVWLQLEAYESDVPWLRYGQEVEFQTETYPGDSFKGQIAFIDPILNDKTRTVRVRVNVENKDSRLKPGMFAHAKVKSNIAAGGKVMDPDLSGKWISPMHPEVVKDKPGSCDVCGMPLVRAEEMGYVSSEDLQSTAAVVIPASAPLITGKRAVVYVQVTDKEGTFEGREIVLGPRAGDYYIVREGLREGELVVVNGNFKIDSAVQLLAKPSMMNPEGGATSSVHQHGKTDEVSEETKDENDQTGPSLVISDSFLNQLENVYTEYFAIQYALSHDQPSEAGQNATKFHKNLEKVDVNLLEEDASQLWLKNYQILKSSSIEIGEAKNIDEARISFEKLSNSMILLARQFGSSGQNPVLLYHCPMAFDFKGADWLQNKEGTENPYFGSEMFTCGTQEEVLSTGKIIPSGKH
jgi:Cu(I)/Ag(I) efflux system membrane fusion protein